jgi:hypothetical protein
VGEIFCTRPDRPWGPPGLLYNGYRVSFPGVKRPGRGVDQPPSSSARVNERVEVYLYSLSGPSWPVLGRTLPLCPSCRASLLTPPYLHVPVFTFGPCYCSRAQCQNDLNGTERCGQVVSTSSYSGSIRSTRLVCAPVVR